jgi:hypothetical protein
VADYFRIAWERFSLIASILGDVQGRLIVTLLYITLVVPFGIGARLLSDPMSQREQQASWLNREPVPDDLDSAREQG